MPHGYFLEEARGTVIVCASVSLVSLSDSQLAPLYELCLWESNKNKMHYGEETVILVLSGEEKKCDVINLMFNCRNEVKQRH